MTVDDIIVYFTIQYQYSQREHRVDNTISKSCKVNDNIVTSIIIMSLNRTEGRISTDTNAAQHNATLYP